MKTFNLMFIYTVCIYVCACVHACVRACVKIIDFSFMPKIIRILSKDHVQ